MNWLANEKHSILLLNISQNGVLYEENMPLAIIGNVPKDLAAIVGSTVFCSGLNKLLEGLIQQNPILAESGFDIDIDIQRPGTKEVKFLCAKITENKCYEIAIVASDRVKK